MTLEAEKISKYSNEGPGGRHLLGAHKVKSQERSQKRKHLVAAALPSTPLKRRAASHRTQYHWILKSMALTIILTVATWFFQRNGITHAPGSDTNVVNVGDDTQSKMLMRLAAQLAALPCSGHGYLVNALSEQSDATCKCYECFRGIDCSQVIDTCVIDLDHGDPTMFPGYQQVSYFAQSRHVWFMESELDFKNFWSKCPCEDNLSPSNV